MKKHNFNAGPSILPREVIEDTAKASESKYEAFVSPNLGTKHP